MTAVGVITITSSLPIAGRVLRGRTFAVREFLPDGYARVVLPPSCGGKVMHLVPRAWVRVA